MKQLILLTAVFMISTVTLANDTTTTETCAMGLERLSQGLSQGINIAEVIVAI